MSADELENLEGMLQLREHFLVDSGRAPSPEGYDRHEWEIVTRTLDSLYNSVCEQRDAIKSVRAFHEAVEGGREYLTAERKRLMLEKYETAK